MSLRFASVCDGISAAACAWVPLGWQFVFKSEIEAFPNAVSDHHFPGVPNLGDMTQFKDWPNYAIDVLVGGTPCQSFSVAGLRAGLADPRGNLALTFLAIAERFRPRWVVWENVPGVHSSWSDAKNRGATDATGEMVLRARSLALAAGLDGETIGSCGGFEEVDQTSDFDCFLAGLEELGYGAATCVLDAQFFGVAQRRERVFVVGHIGGQWQRAAAVLFERACLSGNPPPRRQERKGIAPTISARPTGGGGLGTDFDLDGGLVESSIEGTGLAPTAIRTAQTSANGHGISPECEHTLDGANGQAIAFSAKDSGADAATEVSPTLRALNHDKSHANSGWSVAFPERMSGTQCAATEELSPVLQSHNPTAVAIPCGIDGGQIGFALRSNPSHSGDKGDGGVNTTLVAHEVAPTIGQRMRGQIDSMMDGALVAHALKGEGFDASEDGTGRATPLVPEVAWALQERDSKGSDSKGSDSSTKDGHLLPCQSKTAMAVRRLTPTECEKLQGFPVGWTNVPHRGKPAADGPRYKALGNSMAVPVMRWIAQQIQLVEKYQ